MVLGIDSRSRQDRRGLILQLGKLLAGSTVDDEVRVRQTCLLSRMTGAVRGVVPVRS